MNTETEPRVLSPESRNGEGILVPWVRPLLAGEGEGLLREMEADGHGVPMATHMVVKRGQIIGAFSVGAAVLVMGWAHTQRAKTRDSMIALNVVENLIGATPGAPRTIIVPVSEESPFAPHMEALGYEDLGPMRLWAKKVG